MPGRAASAGALAPQPAACHRGRTRVPTDYCHSVSNPFSHFFSGSYWDFLRSDVCRHPISHRRACLGHRFPPFFENGPLPSRETSKPESDVSSTETTDLRLDIECPKRGDIRSQKSGKKGGKGDGYNPWEIGVSDVRSGQIGRLRRPIWREKGEKGVTLTSNRWGLWSDLCAQMQVIFRKRATNYRALLRKTTYGDKASCGSSPPCILYK